MALTKNTRNGSGVLFVALELSAASWKLALTDGGTRERLVSIPAGDVRRVTAEMRKAKAKFDLAIDAPVLSCYEAGRDGFWIHRELIRLGIQNYVVDPSSIEVDRRSRRAKTDRIDARKLVGQLVRHHERGDRLRIVRVPPSVIEDERRGHRELERLKRERTQHLVRIRSLLALHGIRVKTRCAVGELLYPCKKGSLPGHIRAEIEREGERLALVRQQVKLLEAERTKTLAAKASRPAEIAVRIAQLRGIGPTAAAVLSYELFGWRQFKNRREVGAIAGMVGTPFQSGASSREQGISKSGNRRVRAIAVELAWAWLRHQRHSELTKWFGRRFAAGSSRMRRVGIVALARRLLIAVWRYAEFGVVPDGATLKSV